MLATSPQAIKARLSTQKNSFNLGSGVTGKTDRQIYMTSNQCISGKIQEAKVQLCLECAK
jgi:hypothetical protein